MNWYDNETGKYFKIGSKVIWYGDENEIVGELLSFGNDTFTVKWEDGVTIEYPSTSQDALKFH